MTVLRFALNFNVLTGPVLLTVLWALGWSMMVLGFASRLPVRLLTTLSVLVIVFHNLADSVSLSNPAWKILHQQGIFTMSGAVIVVAYPLVPWIAVMAAGFCFGPVLGLDQERREKMLVRSGLGLTLGFTMLRAMNIYGDPQKWSEQSSTTFTVLSFLRCTKYPPSLDFLLMTLGPSLLLLAWFYRKSPSPSNPLVVIGRVPLFYFLGHMLLAHLLTFPFALFHYGRAAFLFNPPPAAGGPPDGYPPSYGYSLFTVYFAWAIVVAVMYPLCAWFGKVKSRSQSPWIS